MANDIENALKRFRTSAQDFKRNNQVNGLNKEEKRLSEEDLRHYEQLVMMKKYPYLDWKELDYKYSPLSNKNTRQSLKVEPQSYFHIESNLYEPEEIMNVEIINRGLSGFSIPTKIAKGVGMVENKLKFNNVRGNEEKPESEGQMNISKKSSKREALNILQEEIAEYLRNEKV
jgi:hypothetical protein